MPTLRWLSLDPVSAGGAPLAQRPATSSIGRLGMLRNATSPYPREVSLRMGLRTSLLLAHFSLTASDNTLREPS
jgi:hypothetical protein